MLTFYVAKQLYLYQQPKLSNLNTTKKQRLKLALSFGIFFAAFYIADKIINNNHSSSLQILKYVASGLFEGAVTGMIFTWIVALFSSSRFVKSTTKIEVAPDETIVLETPASHFKGMEAVGGKLYLTNKRLTFKSHKFNIQNHQLDILLDEIISVSQYKSLGLVNNGLSIAIRGGVIEKFIVNEIEVWIEPLNEIINFRK